MASTLRLPPPSAPRLPPTTSPLSSVTGSALDVIVIVPSSCQSASSSSSRRRSHNTTDADLSQNEDSLSPPNTAIKKGVVASSDFYVTFPSGLAWVVNNANSTAPNSSSSIVGKSTTKSSTSSLRSYLLNRSKSFLSDIKSSHGSNNRKGGGTNINEIDEEELEEEGIEVGDGSWNALETMSERGTACTEPAHHTAILYAQEHPLLLQQMEQPQPLHSKKRKGNVQIQINGRYIPQLDMIFTSKRGNAKSSNFLSSTLGGGGGSYGDDESTSCRFVTGNGLRPATETLDMLLMEQDVEQSIYDEQSCTCHEAIKRSEFHLCSTTTPTEQDKQKVEEGSSTSATTRRGAILTHGRNLIRYTLFSPTGTIVATAEAHLYLWSSSDSIIVSDIDGTITKSDVRGVIDTVIQDKFEHVHDDICKLFQSILDVENVVGEQDCDGDEEDYFVMDGSTSKQQSSSHPKSMDRTNRVGSEVRFLYLSARPISLISQTRKFLQTVSQQCPARKIHNLPPGPILCHRSALSSVLYSELVAKNIHEFKADVLARQVVLPFVAARGEVDFKPTPYLRKSSDSGVLCADEPTTRSDDSTRNSITEIANTDDERRRMGRSVSGISDASSTWDNRLFLAGFGNKMTDAIAYEMAGIDRGDIYIIDTESNILCVGVNEVAAVDRSDPADLSLSTNKDSCMDPSECSFVEVVCCPGGVDTEIFSGMTAPDHATTRPSIASNSSSHHSTDLLSTDDCRQLDVDRTTETSSDSARRRSSIKEFSSKIPMKKFPSFKLASSMAKKPSRNKLFEGYGDPMLLDRIRSRRVAEPMQII